MPGPILSIPLGTAQHAIELSLTAYPRKAYVTFGTQWDSDLETLTALQAAIGVLWNTHIVPRVDSNVTTSKITSHGTSLTGTAFLSDTPLAYVGGTVGETTPPNVALLVKKGTGLAGRANRGRMYVPWVGIEGSVDEAGNILAAAVTNFQTSFTAFLNGLAARANDSDMVLLHTYEIPAPAPTETVVTSLTVDPRIATQRRRLR